MSELTPKSKEQQTAEADVEHVRKAHGPFVVAAEKTRMPMVFADATEPKYPIIFANDAFLKLTHYCREEVLGRAFNFMLADGNDLEANKLLSAAAEGQTDCDPELRYHRKDGSEFWAAVSISPVKDDDGNVVQLFASFWDLTKHKEEQFQARMLIDELNHRVKNALSAVQSIVTQTLRKSADPKTIRNSIESRLLALSRSHDLLTSQRWQTTGMQDLVRNALEPFGGLAGRTDRIITSGTNIHVPPKVVLALGLALHELASNAVQFGALSNQTGIIQLGWQIQSKPEGDRLVLSWQETGGPPVVAPNHHGFGSRVIEGGLAHELNGSVRIDYRQDGVVCMIDIPAP